MEGSENSFLEIVNVKKAFGSGDTRKYKNTVIMVTHNEAIRGMADHIIL